MKMYKQKYIYTVTNIVSIFVIIIGTLSIYKVYNKNKTPIELNAVCNKIFKKMNTIVYEVNTHGKLHYYYSKIFNNHINSSDVLGCETYLINRFKSALYGLKYIEKIKRGK